MVNKYPERRAEVLASQKRIELTLILSNLLLVVGTILLLWTALFFYERRIKTDLAGENRFITTEWRLLQELKAQTDRQLREKDLEITELRVRYRSLLSQNQSPAEIRELELKLLQAEADRRGLFAARRTMITEVGRQDTPPSAVESPLSQAAAETAPEATASRLIHAGTDEGKAISLMLGKRIQELEAALSASQARAEMAERALNGQKADNRASVGFLTDQSITDAILIELRNKLKVAEAAPPPRIEDIKTRSLLRAIVGSPPIRTEYPDLLAALDRYLEAYGKQQNLNGRKDAFTEAIDTVRAAGE